MYGLKSLFMTCALSLTLAVIFFRNNPYSKLFHIFNTGNNQQKASELNTDRFIKSSSYFHELEKQSEDLFPTEDGVCEHCFDLVIGIITMKRSKEDLGYLTQVVASMGQLIKADSNNKHVGTKALFLCNVDQNPEQHSEANYLKKFTFFTERYGNSTIAISGESQDMSLLFSQSQHRDKYEKELIDYMFCLHRAHSMSRKYVMLIEDDAVPKQNLFPVLDHFLQNRIIMHDGIQRRTFSYIKLYYPQKWQGFGFEVGRIIELGSLAFVGGSMFLLCYFLINHILNRQSVNRNHSHCVFLMGNLFMLIFSLVVGRQNIMELRAISKYLFVIRPSPGCCTQAMLYPVEVIEKMLLYLSEARITDSLHSDIVIYDFVLKYDIPAFQIEPNLFYHVGMYSSLNSKIKNPNEFLFDIKM